MNIRRYSRIIYKNTNLLHRLLIFSLLLFWHGTSVGSVLIFIYITPKMNNIVYLKSISFHRI